MVKRTVEDTAPDLSRTESYFGDVDVEELLAAVGLQTAAVDRHELGTALNGLANIYFQVGLPRESRPTRKQVTEHLDRIDRAIGNLLKLLPGEIGYTLEMYLTAPIYLERVDAHAWVRDTIERLAELRRHVKEAHTLAEQDQTLTDKVTYTGDVALDYLIKGLVHHVWQATAATPHASCDREGTTRLRRNSSCCRCYGCCSL